MTDPKPGELHVSVHGPNVQMEDAAAVGEATKDLLEAVAEAQGIEGITWKVGDIRFRCDGCGLELPDRPSEDAGWTNDGTNDYCYECSIARLSEGATDV